MLDYDAFRQRAGERPASRPLSRRRASACYVEPTSMGAPTLATEAATVRVEASGQVVAYLGTTSHGQSIETTMAQIVADTWGRVRRRHRRAGRHAVDPVRARDGREPDRGHRRRRGA